MSKFMRPGLMAVPFMACLAPLALLTVSTASTAAESADAFPVKPVTVIAAIAPGGPVDAEGRLYMPKMQSLMGQPFIMDFKPGATGTVGAAYVAKAAPDGYTLLMVTSGFTVFPMVYKNLGFDTMKSFEHLSLMSKKPTVLVANPAFAAKDASAYIAYAKANPGKVSFGITGMGSSNHLVGAWIHSATGTTVTFVPYKGLGPMLPDLMAGRVDITSAILSGVLPLIKAGKLRALAMTSDRRSTYLPDVPTVSESGIPGYDYNYWIGFSAPAGTPAAIVDKLSDTFAKVAQLPDVSEVLRAAGAMPVGSTPAQFRKLLLDETAVWQKLVKESGIRFSE